MRKSSIHIEGGNISEFFHNDRSKPTKNSIFTMGNNYCNLSAQEALKLYKRELEKRTKLYTQRTGKKLHKNTKTLLSAIVNLDKHHTKKDVEKLVKWLEKELNTIVIQYSIHNDEGYIDESGQPHVNHHSHLMILGLDNEGRSVRKKLTRDFLRKLQTETAKILNMERGTDVKISRRKRLGTYEYKESMKIKNKEIFELKKELKQKDSEIQELKTSKKELEQKIKKLREQMKNFNASNENKEFTQQDYKALSEIKKMLKAKDLTEVKQKLENFKNEIKTRIQKRQIKLIKNNSEEKGILNKENVINTTKAIQIIKQTTKPNNENFLKILEKHCNNLLHHNLFLLLSM